MSIIPDTTNTLFQLATELVNHSARNIFLTGKAGTGKTTFLKFIRETCPKKMAVVAPTGVAAINAGGVTIHSMFQLPVAPFLPGNFVNENGVNKHELLSRLKMRSEKRKVLRELELLVIDEISMVRCDTLDAVDTILRYVRNRPDDMFGGVQVIFIGDMFQLPPVVRDQEWNMMAEYYASPYFFDSRCILESPPLYIEFTRIYRQSDTVFIDLLNQVRNNELNESGKAILASRFQPGFKRTHGDGNIVLTSHNETARQINAKELQQLEGKLYEFKAIIDAGFPSNAYPGEEVLQLKKGAQVMFIKNDTEKGKRFFNGKLGFVADVQDDKIWVQCQDEPDLIEVGKETWENVRYSVNRTTRLMEQEVLGSFVQYPLRLAWAITIHKSQGLTFEKAIVDAGRSFAPGQVYVALSRCTNLGGLVLQSEINSHNLSTDQRIVEFSRRIASAESLKTELAAAKKHYQEKIILSSFDFSNALALVEECQLYLVENSSSFNNEAHTWLDTLQDKLNATQATAIRFHTWLMEQFNMGIPMEDNQTLHDRLKKATIHFSTEIDNIIDSIKVTPIVTDSTLHAKELNDSLREVAGELTLKKHLLVVFGDKFDIVQWHQRKKEFRMPSFSINVYAGATSQKVISPHPALYQELKKLRDEICSKQELPIYMVAGSATLDELARYLPQTLSELKRITGFGNAKVNKYGQAFLDIIIQYCESRDLESRIDERSAAKQNSNGKSSNLARPKGASQQESLKLYQQGLSIADIAASRKMAISTIEGHLVHFVAEGAINIDDFVSKEKIALIEPLVDANGKGSLNTIREKLNNQVTFSDIRWVVARSRFLAGQDSNSS